MARAAGEDGPGGGNARGDVVEASEVRSELATSAMVCTIRSPPVSPLTAVDLFSGAGGTTQGLRDAGYKVVAAVENDATAVETFRANHHDVHVLARPIQHVRAPALARRLGSRIDLLTACPPCQPFSTLGTGDASDPRNRLILSIRRFVDTLRPRVVLLENVPGIQNEPRFRQLLVHLTRTHAIREYVVHATDFGVPQRRRRLIVLAVAGDSTLLPDDLVAALPHDFDVSPRSAADALALAADLTERDDPVHRARVLQPKTLQRIRAVAPGGGRAQLPSHLQLACHKRLKGANATSVYGRIDPDQPAPTMTTRCTTPSCGRFVHPHHDRGLTLREAALLQTFPASYKFVGSHGQIERQIGNAVPPRLAEGLGRIVSGLLAFGDPGSADQAA